LAPMRAPASMTAEGCTRVLKCLVHLWLARPEKLALKRQTPTMALICARIPARRRPSRARHTVYVAPVRRLGHVKFEAVARPTGLRNFALSMVTNTRSWALRRSVGVHGDHAAVCAIASIISTPASPAPAENGPETAAR